MCADPSALGMGDQAKRPVCGRAWAACLALLTLVSCGPRSDPLEAARVAAGRAPTTELPPVPGEDRPYPSLGTVPDRPVPPSAETRRRISEALVADRENARHAGPPVTPRQVETAPAPPAQPSPLSSQPASPFGRVEAEGAPLAGIVAPVVPPPAPAVPPIAGAPAAPRAEPAAAPPPAPPADAPRIPPAPPDPPPPVLDAAAAPAPAAGPPRPPEPVRAAPPVPAPAPPAPAPVPPPAAAPAAPAPAAVSPAPAAPPPPPSAAVPVPDPSVAVDRSALPPPRQTRPVTLPPGQGAALAFAPGSAALTGEARAVVARFAAGRRGATVRVTGFRDTEGGDLGLALARAQAVAQALRASGTPAEAIELAAEPRPGPAGRGAEMRLVYSP